MVVLHKISRCLQIQKILKGALERLSVLLRCREIVNFHWPFNSFRCRQQCATNCEHQAFALQGFPYVVKPDLISDHVRTRSFSRKTTILIASDDSTLEQAVETVATKQHKSLYWDIDPSTTTDGGEDTCCIAYSLCTSRNENTS